MSELKPIKAHMVTCGEIDLDDGDAGYSIPNALLLQCEDEDWRVSAGNYYVVPEELWNDVRRETIEECARIVDALVRLNQSYPSAPPVWRSLQLAADRIRALAATGAQREIVALADAPREEK